MATTAAQSSPAAQVEHALDYVLSRLATHYAQKAGQIARFIEWGLRAEGWFAMEAFHNLATSTAGREVQVEAVRGRSQGEAEFNPDLQLRIGSQSHQIAIKSLPIRGERNIPHYFSTELPSLFQWVTALKERAALVTIAYPCSLTDEAWTEAVSRAEADHQMKAVEHKEFVVPRPPLPQVKACLSLWRHSSMVPTSEDGDAA